MQNEADKPRSENGVRASRLLRRLRRRRCAPTDPPHHQRPLPPLPLPPRQAMGDLGEQDHLDGAEGEALGDLALVAVAVGEDQPELVVHLEVVRQQLLELVPGRRPSDRECPSSPARSGHRQPTEHAAEKYMRGRGSQRGRRRSRGRPRRSASRRSTRARADQATRSPSVGAEGICVRFSPGPTPASGAEPPSVCAPQCHAL